MAWESLRGHKLRSALTLLGMVIGVFAIIVSVTAVKVIDVYFKEKLQFLGASTFTISRTPPIQINDGGPGLWNRPRITYEQVERFKPSMNIPVSVSVLEDFHMGAVHYGGRETPEPNVFLMGSDENMLGNFSYELDQGRFFTEEDVLYARSVVVLGSKIANDLFVNETPLGKEVRVGGHKYQVIGVLKEKGSFLGFNQDNRLFAPLTRCLTLYGYDRNIASISVRVHNPAQLQAAMEEAIGRMRTIRKVRPGEDNNFEISTNDSMQSIFDAFTGTLTTAGAGIGFISLLAAGIGIMNIMLVSVTERTREIGIRKSLGAKRRDIMRQFLIEAFFLCQIGGLLGILLGALVGNFTALYFEISATFPVGWAIAAVVLVTAVALIFGGYPALKAARLRPIESLRYE
jgi:putative ABC transport system permease protein